MKLRELTEAPYQGYGQDRKPEWFDKAVQLKKNNPDMSLRQIADQVGTNHVALVSRWLTGLTLNKERGSSAVPGNPNPPFSKADFPGMKVTQAPEWLPDAEKLKTDNPDMSATAIGKQLGVNRMAVLSWLTGELPAGRGKIGAGVPGYKPKFSKADFARTADARIKAILNQVNNMLANNMSDDQIVDQINDQYGIKFASDIKSRLPDLRQQQKADISTNQVIDKTRTGDSRDPDITGLI